MVQSLNDFMRARIAQEYATNAGTALHARMARVVIDGPRTCGDAELVREILARADIAAFFGPESRTEVPIAANINGHVVSRRIDRMIVDDAAQTVRILDYKTDVNKTEFQDKYVAQLREYAAIMRRIYPKYKITTHILWTHDWTLQEI